MPDDLGFPAGGHSAARTQYASHASQGSGCIVTYRHAIQNGFGMTLVIEDQRVPGAA